MEKNSINDLIEMASYSPEDRAIRLHETLKIGFAKCAMRLSEMPFGFCNAPGITRVTTAYVQNFRQVMEFESRSGIDGLTSKDYHDLTLEIFEMHRGTMLDVAKGVFEFNEDLQALFGQNLELAEVRDDLQVIRDIETSLDKFFTERLTLRLLISHVHNLNKQAQAEGGQKGDMLGVVNVNTQPIIIMSRAFTAARYMCMRDFDMAPDLTVNGVLHDEYILSDVWKQQTFPYVHTHLFYIFLELIKNAARASILRAKQDNPVGPIHEIPNIILTLPEEQMWDLERSVKLADRGTGMNRQVLGKAFSYYYSSVKARPKVADEVSDFDRRAPLAGFGFGLPISRVMARYFAGDIDVNSIPGKGTDVYVYL